ncbi:MAG: sigma-54-dependent transcriptional regulator [Negativicutes bacterium]
MRILVVDDDKDSRVAISWFLRDQEHEVTECANAKEALALVSIEDYPLVLTDINMPNMSGMELLLSISALPESWRTDVVLFTGYGDMKSAIDALRAGAYDYLLKPIDAQELALVIDRVSEHQALVRENRQLTNHLDAEVQAATDETKRELRNTRKLLAKTIIGSMGIFSDSTQSTIDLAQKYHTDRSLPVLIQGETGTGKEIIARIIHFGLSALETAAGPFVDINCAAIAPSLFESELFGYESGSFTGGSTRGQKGKLDAAAGGTLFLDEISEIPLEKQAKLLRLLQEKEYYRVGGLKKCKADVRFIFATNVDLEKQIEAGLFRRDLYYRLKVGQIFIKPLRNRREEILPLAKMFLAEFSRQRKKRFISINSDAAKMLNEYSWPGNVRELKNMMEWISFIYNDEEVQRTHIEKFLRNGIEFPSSENTTSYLPDAATDQIILPVPPNGHSLKEYNDDLIRQVLAIHNGNQTVTARYLKMSLRALCYRLEQMQKKSTTT